MRWHHVKIFDYEYAFCPSEKEWVKYWKQVKRKTIPNYLQSDARCTFFETVSDGYTKFRAIVTVAEHLSNSPLEIVALLAHEAVHIKQDICEHMGERNISSEMEAYLVQVVLQDLLYAYKDTRL